MKKQTFLSVLSLFLIVIFTFNKAKAHPGDSCASAITLSLSSVGNHAFNSPDTVVWFSFTADSANMIIAIIPPTIPIDTPTADIHKLSLYSGSCGSLSLIGSSSIRLGSDSLPVLYKTGLTVGTRYYVSVSKYNTVGCRICSKYPTYFAIAAKGVFSTPMVSSPCVTPCGTNLICNWNFTVNAPVGSPNCYDLPSATCSGPTSGMNYTSNPCGFSGNADEYLVESVNPNSYLFEPPTGPAGEPYSFWGDSPGINQNCTSVVAWQQLVGGLTVNHKYQFSMYYMDLDNLTNLNINTYPPAALTMVVGTATTTVSADINTWQEVCLDWVATTNTVTVQILDACYPGSLGYDFQLNDISFNEILGISVSVTAPPCYGGLGSATATVTGGSSPYTYSWYPSGQTTATVTGLSVGTYTVSVSDNGNCANSEVVTITQPAQLIALMGTPNDPPCYGLLGNVTVLMSGGTSPYTYVWTPSGGTNAHATGLSVGGYTVFVTDLHGCTASANVTITQPTLLTVGLPSNPIVCGPGGVTSLTATPGGGTPGYTYLWTPTGQTNVTATGLSAGTYTVTVTDANNCTATSSVTINTSPLPPAPVVSVPAMACGPTTVTVTNPAVGASYTWAVNGGTYNSITSPGTSVSATIEIAATLTCVATYTATGCTSSTTFTMAPCCANTTSSTGGPIYNQIINGNQLASIVGTSFVNQTILINGTFTVDQSTTFTACDVQFTTGSSIIVNSGKALNIYSTSTTCSHFHAALGCCMWQGIIINPGGMLNSHPNSGTLMPLMIEDALTAVNVVTSSTNPGLYSLNEVIFNKNYQDIVINPTSVTYMGSATGCIFTCRNLSSNSPCYWYTSNNWNSASPTNLICPNTSKRSYTGITLNNVGSYGLFKQCFFDYHTYGVYSTGSNLAVYGNFFQNLTVTGGAGVYATGALSGNALNVGRAGAYQANEFHNCKVGVEANNHMNSVSVLYNEFINTTSPGNDAIIAQYGYTTPASAGFINISYDTITNFLTGIWEQNNAPTTALNEYDTIRNAFCSTSPSYYGIQVSEALSTGQYTIERNVITSLNYGISTTGLTGAIIYSNYITVGPPQSTGCALNDCKGDGISFKGGNNSRIHQNIVNAPYGETYASHTYTKLPYVGIYENMSMNLSEQCNTINNALYQLECDGIPFNGTGLYSNTMNTTNTADIGMYLIGGAFVPAISVSGSNNANDLWNSANFLCRSSVLPVTLPLSQCPTCYYNTAVCTPSTYSHCGSCTKYAVPLPALSRVSLTCPALPVIVHSGPVVVVDTTSVETVTFDSIPSKFNNSPDSTTIAFMEEIARGADTVDLYNDTDKILDMEAVLETLWQNKGLLSSYTILHNFNDSLSAKTLGRIWKVDSSIAYVSTGGIIVGVSNPYPALLDTLNLITPASNIETNLKAALTDYLDLMINDSLSSMQIAGLWTLADLCPRNDGPGVFMARALVSPYDSVQVTWNDSLCGSGNIPHKAEKREEAQTITDNVQFNLYPNPNNGNFTLEYNLGIQTNGIVRIFNMFGQMVGEYTLNTSQGKMSISNPELSNGVYIWRVYSNEQPLKFGKVVIMK